MTGARTLTRDNLPSVPRSHTFTSENLPPLLSPSPTHVHQWVEGELRDGEQLVARHVALATAIKGTEAAVQCCDLLLRNCRHTSRQAGRQAGRQTGEPASKEARIVGDEVDSSSHRFVGERQPVGVDERKPSAQQRAQTRCMRQRTFPVHMLLHVFDVILRQQRLPAAHPAEPTATTWELPLPIAKE